MHCVLKKILYIATCPLAAETSGERSGWCDLCLLGVLSECCSMDSWWSAAAVTPDERKNSVDTWMDIVEKAMVIGQLLPGGGAIGAVCQDVTTQRCQILSHYWEQSRPSEAGAPEPPVSVPPPLLVWTHSLSPRTQDHPPPLIYYQLHYLFLSRSLTSARLWHSSIWYRVCVFSFLQSCVWASLFLLLKRFKRLYLQEHFMDVTLTWRESFKGKSLRCPVLFYFTTHLWVFPFSFP